MSGASDEHGSAVSHLLCALVHDLERHPPFRFPPFRGLVRAAVAVIVRPLDDDLELVLIGRTRRQGDRWSGDVAFPGGMAAPCEPGTETARRETEEEIGLRLGDPLGFLADRVTLAPRAVRLLRVRPVLFLADDVTSMRPDAREVGRVYRTSLTALERAPREDVTRSLGPLSMRFRGRAVGEHVLWGMTASLVEELRTRIRGGSAP